jgi:acetyl esterase/lipase
LGNNIDEVCDALRQLIAKISPARVVTIGQSMGAYAAILFGQLLAVEQVVAFGPLSFLDSNRAIEMGDSRWLAVMQNLEANLPEKCYFDLLNKNGTGQPKIDIFYGQKPDPETPGDINLDDIHARRLATLPNSTLYPYKESGHAIVQHLIDHNLIDSVLLKALFDIPI